MTTAAERPPRTKEDLVRILREIASNQGGRVTRTAFTRASADEQASRTQILIRGAFDALQATMNEGARPGQPPTAIPDYTLTRERGQFVGLTTLATTVAQRTR